MCVKSWLLKLIESDLKTKIFVKTAKFQAGKYLDYIFATIVFQKLHVSVNPLSTKWKKTE